MLIAKKFSRCRENGIDRLRNGHAESKMNLYFTSEIDSCVDPFSTSMALKTCSGSVHISAQLGGSQPGKQRAKKR